MQNPKNTANLPSPDDCRYDLATLVYDHDEDSFDRKHKYGFYPLFPPRTSYAILRVLREMLIPPMPPRDCMVASYKPYAAQLESQLIELSGHCKNLSDFLEEALKLATILKQSVDYAASHEPDKP